jgi:glycosyltransferase involved in cell wall biosynthesis
VTDGPVVLDLQAIQSPHHRGRGIARYAYEVAAALEEVRPDLIGRILLNPDLAPPGEIGPLLASGKVAYSGTAGALPGGARIFHSLSPFELDLPLHSVWPREVSRRGLALALSVYDLIPEVLSHHYLRHPGPRARYRTRLAFVEAADHLLAISQAAKGQVIERLRVDSSRISVVGTGTSPRFRPPESKAVAMSAAREGAPGLGAEFVLYTGGTDYRKNIESLIRAYGLLPAAMRERWQLVVACEMTGQPYAHYSYVCRTLGIEDRVLLTGYVSDDTLLALYQSAGLFVFPSLAEGYGLPVAEAIACGAAALGSDIAALRELIPADQRFDPSDVGAIAASLERALGDDGWRGELASRAGAPATTWTQVAEATAQVYELMLRSPGCGNHSWRSRRAVAFVSPFPPSPTGVAHHSLRLTEEIVAGDRVDLDVFVDDEGRGPQTRVLPDDAGGFPISAFDVVEALRGGYDEVVSTLGNSDCHIGALALLRRRRGGTVIAHDVRLTNLYWFGREDPAAVPGGFGGTLARLYGDSLPVRITAGRDRPTPSEEEQYGLLMVREVLDLADRVLFTSHAAQALAKLDALDRPVDEKLGVLPFAAEPQVPSLGGFEAHAVEPAGLPPGDYPLVVALGIVHPVRQPLRVLEAFASARRSVVGAQLAFVGPAPEALADSLRARAAALGVSDAVHITGQVGSQQFLWFMQRATAAVQLRGSWNGEAAYTVGECLVAGVPVIVSDIGWAHELPGGCVVKVAPDLADDAFGDLLAGLLRDDVRREQLVRAARAYGAANLSFATAAERLVDLLLESGPR